MKARFSTAVTIIVYDKSASLQKLYYKLIELSGLG